MLILCYSYQHSLFSIRNSTQIDFACDAIVCEVEINRRCVEKITYHRVVKLGSRIIFHAKAAWKWHIQDNIAALNGIWFHNFRRICYNWFLTRWKETENRLNETGNYNRCNRFSPIKKLHRSLITRKICKIVNILSTQAKRITISSSFSIRSTQSYENILRHNRNSFINTVESSMQKLKRRMKQMLGACHHSATSTHWHQWTNRIIVNFLSHVWSVNLKWHSGR